MSNPIQPDPTRPGAVSWSEQPGDVYVVTGTLFNGRRFKPIRTSDYFHARAHNVYRGTLWLERDGRRYRITTFAN